MEHRHINQKQNISLKLHKKKLGKYENFLETKWNIVNFGLFMFKVFEGKIA